MNKFIKLCSDEQYTELPGHDLYKSLKNSATQKLIYMSVQ